jgi:hypothetical protein
MSAGISAFGRPSVAPAIAALIVALGTSGCLPGPIAPAGSRELVITVTNHSQAPAMREVAPIPIGIIIEPNGEPGWTSPEHWP